MKGRLSILACTVAALVLPAAPANAQQLPPAVKKVFEDFGRDGAISPCKHAIEELRATKRLIPPDIDQYAPDFPPAVDAALEAHARGECAGTAPQPAPATGGGDAVPSATPVPTAIPTKEVASEAPAPEATPVALAVKRGKPPTPDTALERVAAAESSSDAPAPVWMLGGGAGLLGLVALGTILAGRTRRGAQGLDSFRHAWSETAWRASGTWSDFSDWLRAGR